MEQSNEQKEKKEKEKKKEKKEKKAKKDKKTKPVVVKNEPPAAPVVTAETETAQDSDEIPLEIIAVIAAAVAAVWDKPESGFVVRRVRRISNSPLSARLARDEQMYSHF